MHDAGVDDTHALTGGPGMESPQPVLLLSPDWGEQRSHLIPALDIVGFDALLNQFNRHAINSRVYGSTLSSIRRNLQQGWHVDHDPYKTNQILHPYQGSMYHGFARSAGLGYWQSSAYTFLGSALWEIGGETTPPSKNDQVASGIAGSFLGEPLFRMSSLVLEQGGDHPGPWRKAAAAVISPATGFNRLAFGDRFDAVFDSHDPAYFGSLELGTRGTIYQREGPATKLQRAAAIVDFSMDYGLPGKPGYSYDRPFDYFHFHVIGSSANAVQGLNTDGLLLGTRYEAGAAYRGIWGLYGSYDYLAPQLFRVSSTALSVGTTGQWRLPGSVVIQDTALLGAGYAAAGTLNATGPSDYHYGIAPQSLLGLRLIFADRALLAMTAREYFVSNVAAAARGGRNNIVRANVSLTVRIHRHQAVGIKYLWTRRDASLRGLPDVTQVSASLGLFYTLLMGPDLGVVDY